MPIPWLRLLDIALGLTNLAQSRSALARTADADAGSDDNDDASGSHDARLASVVASVLREVLERDARKMQMLREKAEADRQRAERALRVELLSRAADREASRLRLLAGGALVSWIGTIVAGVWMNSDSLAVRVLFGSGTLLELASFASALLVHTTLSDPLEVLATTNDMTRRKGIAGLDVALWLLIAGLVLVGVAVVL
ncbi:MAG: hypothetical protein HY048_05550 [Acidobacteria bacterium]|nr:hypothetical protein [Acidobacteriota bacterium]